MPELTVRAPRLRAGDLAMIVNPSRALPGDDPLRSVRAGVAGLEAAGLRVRIAPHVGERWLPPDDPDGGALGGTDAERAQDLNDAFADPEVRLVLAAWGGGGARRLLAADLVDWSSLVASPKLLCGFSDFAHILLAARVRTGLVTIDGPSALQWAAGPADPMLAQAWSLLTTTAAPGLLATAPLWYATQLSPTIPGAPPTRARPGTRSWPRPGNAEGRLVAALPSVLISLATLGLAPSLDGAIWCLDAYRDDAATLRRSLVWLRRAGHLRGLSGIVMARAWPSSAAPPLIAVVLDETAGLTPPPVIVTDVDSGHTWPKWSLPNGVRASLDSASDRIALLEPAVAD